MSARSGRSWLIRCGTWRAGQPSGSFFDIGTGIPTANNTHQVAQGVEPDCKVVYADNDPMVLVQARALLVGTTARTPTSMPTCVTPARSWQKRPGCRTSSKPVAVMLISILHLVPDEDDPHAIVTRLMEALPSGSWLALSHPACDIHTQQVTEAASRFNQLSPAKATLRTRAEILRFFDGLELLEPGLVQVHRWRPGVAVADSNQEAAGYCGLTR